MAESYNSGSVVAAVTISGGVTALPAKVSTISGRTLVQKQVHFTSVTANAANTIHSVTASKKLFITTLIVHRTSQLRIGDNISGNAADTGAIANSLYFSDINAEGLHVVEFPVPLEIDTSLVMICSGTGACSISFVGWEEAE